MSLYRKIKYGIRSLGCLVRGEAPISSGEITKDLVRGCVGKDDPVILEIGCNDGTHSLWLSEIFRKPKVFCFEPDPRAIARFKSNVKNHPDIKLFEIALCDYDGKVDFFQSDGHKRDEHRTRMPDGWDLSGSIRQPKEHLITHPWIKFENKIEVPAMTLDTWCNEQNIETIDFIWMDVQGAEIDVFRGGGNSLKKTRFIYTEYSNRELYEGQMNLQQLTEYLKDFTVIKRYPRDVLMKNLKYV